MGTNYSFIYLEYYRTDVSESWAVWKPLDIKCALARILFLWAQLLSGTYMRDYFTNIQGMKAIWIKVLGPEKCTVIQLFNSLYHMCSRIILCWPLWWCDHAKWTSSSGIHAWFKLRMSAFNFTPSKLEFIKLYMNRGFGSLSMAGGIIQ